MKEKGALVAYFRNFVFGVEDSLVSTVGLLSGVAIAGMEARQIFLTGVVLIFVEAISMAAGSFLSESSAEELETRSEKTSVQSYLSALIMFVSYFVSGFIPLLPYVLLPVTHAFWVSIVVSVVSLFALGLGGAKLSKTRMLPNAVKMVFIGGLAIGVGVLVGKYFG